MLSEDQMTMLRRLFPHKGDSIKDATRLTGAERNVLVYARQAEWITKNYVLTPKGHLVLHRVLTQVSN